MNTHKVVWKEGMLLRPQHFQQQDRYLNHQLRTSTQLLNPYGWGFVNLRIDEGHLASGKLVLSQAEGILQDGSLFQLDKTLAVELPAGQGRTPVYLGLAMTLNGSKDTHNIGDQELTRYVTREHTLTDTNVGRESKCEMVCATTDLRLLLGHEPDHAYFITLKLGEIQAAENGRGFSLVEGFTPTCLHASAEPMFASYLNAVLGMLGARGAQLAERVGTQGEVGGAQIGDFLMLQVVNRHEVLLRHLQHAPQVHPEAIYLALATLLGELCVFNNRTRRPDPALRYNHADQSACMSAVVEAITDTLAMVLEQHAVQLPIVPAKFGILVANITDHSVLDTSYLVMVASAACGAEQLRSRLPTQLKIGTAETLRDLVNLHLPGIKVAPLAVAPRQLPYHANKAYFRLEADAEQRAALQATAAIAMHLSGELDGFELELWAVRT